MESRGFGTEFLEELKSRSNIVQIIQKYIPLERKGRNFWGRCPFHHEKTPSFAVNEDNQFYHCFGCSASGDVIKFVMEMESIDFMEAVKVLCNSAGIQMPELKANSIEVEQEKKLKDRLFLVLKETANYYYRQLGSCNGEPARAYIEKRALSPEIVRLFALGYCPDYTGTIDYLKDKGFTTTEMKLAGVAGEKNGRFYDPLGGRLIIPIVNHFGDVIAFGGRVLEKSEFGKYQNTTETKLFNKRKNLYGINLLKKLKQESGIRDIIMVEGYMDTIALYQAGFRNVVASMGTALTKEQARLLSKYSSNILISYDGDSAGQKATLRGLDILTSEGLNVRVVALPDELDPDELIKLRGREAYEMCLEQALPLVDFKLVSLMSEYDVQTIEGKRKYTMEALKVVSEVSSSTEQEDCLKRIRRETGFTLESLKRDLENIKLQPVQENIPLIHRPQVSEEVSTEMKGIRVLLYGMLTGLEPLSDLALIIPHLTNSYHRQIVDYLQECAQKGSKPVSSVIYEFVAEEGTDEVVAVLSVGELFSSLDELKRYYEDSMKTLFMQNMERNIEGLISRIENERKIDERRKLSCQLMELTKELKALRK